MIYRHALDDVVYSIRDDLIHKSLELRYNTNNNYKLLPYESIFIRDKSNELDSNNDLCKGNKCMVYSTLDKGCYKRKSKLSTISPYDTNVMIYCNGPINCLDVTLLHPVCSASSNDMYYVMVAVGTSNFMWLSKNYHTNILIYGLPVKCLDCNESNGGVGKNDLSNDISVECSKLLISLAIKDDSCLKLKWLNSMDQLLLVTVLESGSLNAYKCPVDTLYDTWNDTKNCYHAIYPTIIWEFKPVDYMNGEIVTCIDVMDGVYKTIVAGTSKGYVLVFKFDNDNFNLVYSKTIAIFYGFNDVMSSKHITNVAFLPTDQSYLIAISSYSGLVVLWDIRQGHLEGEVATFGNITRPINGLSWTLNCQYLLGGSNSGFLIEWQQKSQMCIVMPEKFMCNSRSKYHFENICWDVASTNSHVIFTFDEGLLIKMPIINLNKKSITDDFIAYKWELSGQDNSYTYKINANDDIVKTVEGHLREKFEEEFKAMGHSISITKYITKIPDIKSNTKIIKSKLNSLHTVVANSYKLHDTSLDICGYGGNFGLLHLIVSHY